MKCDWCNEFIWITDLEVRSEPTHPSWHVHLDPRCAAIYDGQNVWGFAA